MPSQLDWGDPYWFSRLVLRVVGYHICPVCQESGLSPRHPKGSLPPPLLLWPGSPGIWEAGGRRRKVIGVRGSEFDSRLGASTPQFPRL